MNSIKDIANNMTIEKFNERFQEEIQGVRDILTNRLYYCPNDLGFKLSSSNCYKGLICKQCWKYAKKKLENNKTNNK